MATGPTPAAGAAAVHRLLQDAHVDHRLVDHDTTYRARDEAQAAELPAGRMAKTVVTVERGQFRLAVIPASRRIDLQRLRSALHASGRLRLATERELADAFPDFEVGAVPPLGALIGVEEVVDPLVLDEREVLATAGDHTHGVLVDPERLVEAAGARVADICQHADDSRAHRFTDVPMM